MLLSTFNDLNTKKEVTLVEHGLVCRFNVRRSYSNPEKIDAYSVPLFIMGDPKKFGKDSEDLDLTMKKVDYRLAVNVLYSILYFFLSLIF